MDLCDQQQSGWPVSTTNVFHMKKFGKQTKSNWQTTQRKIAVKLGILQECTDHIIDGLQYQEISA